MTIIGLSHSHCTEVREREARYFFSWFSKEKKSSSWYESRVPRNHHFSIYACHCCVTVSSCVIQHCFRPRSSTALNAHTAPMPVPAGSVHAHTDETFSRQRVYRHIWLGRTEPKNIKSFCFLSSTYKRVLVGRLCLSVHSSRVRAVP